MYPLAICRLSAPLAVRIFRASIAVAETVTVGAVDNVQAHVEQRKPGRPVRWVSNRKSISRIDAPAEKARAFRWR
jgi:hypothetical protein